MWESMDYVGEGKSQYFRDHIKIQYLMLWRLYTLRKMPLNTLSVDKLICTPSLECYQPMMQMTFRSRLGFSSQRMNQKRRLVILTIRVSVSLIMLMYILLAIRKYDEMIQRLSSKPFADKIAYKLYPYMYVMTFI